MPVALLDRTTAANDPATDADQRPRLRTARLSAPAGGTALSDRLKRAQKTSSAPQRECVARVVARTAEDPWWSKWFVGFFVWLVERDEGGRGGYMRPFNPRVVGSSSPGHRL